MEITALLYTLAASRAQKNVDSKVRLLGELNMMAMLREKGSNDANSVRFLKVCFSS